MGTLYPAISGVLTNSRSFISGASPFIGGISQILNAGEQIFSNPIKDQRAQIRAEQDLALEQLQNRQRLEEQQLVSGNASERQRIATEAVQAEDQRRNALRRAVARQRASFGSQGVGAGGGSSEAVLLGLFDESDQERKRREELDVMKTSALDQNYSNLRSMNLLQATQLAERQKLSRYYY